MSDLDQITSIIDTILSTNNEARIQSEALLQNLRDKDFNQYIFAFTTVLKDSPRAPVRTFCLAHLRRLLSDFLEGEDGKWFVLTPETQKFVKELALHLIKNEQDSGSRKVLCDFIGELASTIQTLDSEVQLQMTKEGTEWNELMKSLWELLDSNNEVLMESALRVLSVLFTNCGRQYAAYNEDLLPLLRQTLTHQSGVVSVSAMEALAAYIENVEFKLCRPFLELMPLFISQTLVVTEQNEDYALDALAAIGDIIDTEPKMFRKEARNLIEMLKTLIKGKVEDNLKQAAFETLMTVVERLPKQFTEDMQAVKEIAELVFTYMISTTEEADEEWLCPPDGYLESIVDDDAHDASIRFGMDLIDRMIGCLNRKPTLAMFSQLIGEMVKTENWKYQFAALMSLSQVGEYIDDLDDFEPIVSFIINFLQSNHPKVRFASFQCLGQFAEDCKPAFQKRYGETVFPALFSMYNDRVPKIQYHALNSTAHMLEECPHSLAVKHMNQILESAFHFVEQGRSYTKESALTVIGNLAETTKQDFAPYWEKCSDIIFTVLNNTRKELKNVKGQCIEALTLIGEAVGKTEFKKICHPVIEKMVEIQTNDIGKLDPQNSYLLTSWHRICGILHEEFAPYLNFVMPSIFKLVEDIIEADQAKDKKILDSDMEQNLVSRSRKDRKQNEQDDEDELLNQVNTGESDDIVTSICMMRGFAYELKSGYLPYAEKTSDLIVLLISKSSNPEVREQAADTFVDLIGVISDSNHPDKQTILRKLNNSYLAQLWESAWSELDPEMMRKYVDIMMDVLVKAGKVMNDEELELFNKCVLKTLELSDKRKVDNNVYHEQNADVNDEDDEEMLIESNKLEEELHMALAELIGTLFKVYKEQTMPLVRLIYNDILPKAMEPNMPPMLNKFGLYLIDDMIEHLGLELIPNEWPQLSEVLVKYATHQNVEVRTAAAYGVGALAENSKDIFRNMSDICMKVLYEALEISKGPLEELEVFGAQHDVMVGCLGRIIKSQSANIDVKQAIRTWIGYLPLRFDNDEAKIQHELLVDIILDSDAALVFGDNGENLPQIMKVLAEAADSKTSSAEFRPKVSKVIHLLASNETTKGLLQGAVAKLDAKTQAKLKKIADSN